MYITRNRHRIEGKGALWDKCGGVTPGEKIWGGCRGLFFVIFRDGGVLF